MIQSLRNGLRSLLTDNTGNYSSRLCAGWLLLFNFLAQSWFQSESGLIEVELYTAAAMLGLSVVDNFSFRNKYLNKEKDNVVNEVKTNDGGTDTKSAQLDLFDN